MFIITPAAEWWRGLSRTVKIIGYVGVVMGAITATATAWPTIEPWLAATRGYVRDSHAPLLGRIIVVQLKQNHNERERLLEEVKKRELELQSDQAKATPQYQALVKDRVERIKARINALDKDDNNLFNEQKSK